MVLSHLWKIIQEFMVHKKTFAKKKAPNIVWLLVEYIKILDISDKIKNFLGWSRASIIKTYLIKLLSTEPSTKALLFWKKSSTAQIQYLNWDSLTSKHSIARYIS